MDRNSTTEWRIPLYKIYTDDEDVNLVTKIIKRGSNWALGPEIEELENEIKNYVGVDYCISLNSGTSALHATLMAYGLGENDEVVVPSFSFISTITDCSVLLGPLLIDSIFPPAGEVNTTSGFVLSRKSG